MESKDNTAKLFNDFPPVTTGQWEEKIIEDLKGADYDKKLVWKTPEGINVKPYYRGEHISNLPYIGTLPGHYPFVRGNKTSDNSWEIRQCIDVSEIKEANRIAVNAISKGATALSLDVSEVQSASDLDELLKDIPLEKTDIHYYGSRNYPQLLNQLAEVCKKHNVNAMKISGSMDFDPISYVLLRGDFYNHESVDFGQAFDLIKLGGKIAPKFRFISINGHYIHNSGGNIIQELAFTMASASDYVAKLTGKGLAADEILPSLNFIFASGNNYFMEIAKFRAARILWARIAEQYNPGDKNAMKAYVHAITSNWNKTVYDPYVNMLRTTTEAMAAAVAGVNSITLNPFDTPFREADDFSRRIARNQQILLKEESYLDKVIDPAAGSYYIEQLTGSLASHAWELFVKVEQMGGMTQAVKNGFIQDEVEKSANGRRQDVANRRQVLLGTNMHPNQDERMLNRIQEETDSEDESTAEATKYKTLSLGRASDAFEDLRLATEIFIEEGNKQPEVFMFTMGNLAMRKARASFSSGFFGCAGYKIIDNTGFKNIEGGIEAVKRQNPEIVVICSSDEEYVEIVPEICKQLKSAGSKAIPVLAGYPKEHIETFRQAGIDEFIHVRSNVLETLAGFHRKLGIV
jgi:methylmalonyl-CoA mutase